MKQRPTHLYCPSCKLTAVLGNGKLRLEKACPACRGKGQLVIMWPVVMTGSGAVLRVWMELAPLLPPGQGGGMSELGTPEVVPPEAPPKKRYESLALMAADPESPSAAWFGPEQGGIELSRATLEDLAKLPLARFDEWLKSALAAQADIKGSIRSFIEASRTPPKKLAELSLRLVAVNDLGKVTGEVKSLADAHGLLLKCPVCGDDVEVRFHGPDDDKLETDEALREKAHTEKAAADISAAKLSGVAPAEPKPFVPAMRRGRVEWRGSVGALTLDPSLITHPCGFRTHVVGGSAT